ncbi:phosphate-starvation-inducible PsiE family protein [Aliarcobacter cibarius]|uniref:Putative membrane protein n=1 Tax=Aliarcobacter cibarius TaxID=255507 RepID=A0A5J6RJA1_9BACT|nr:phosphate-starvation-inducible PsiE family protein [Aliarcobacter cibarius]QEZ89975.1 putative membrane protein [Aliarcobacter cibarius]QKJ27986.1 putative membrane protein [Aliarcobacter cibarius]TLT01263.1 hypothetical protein FE247_01930 [Aliarcobacter cibarius]TLT01668.1 hypothetical protein FE245_01930 [Aliarcobacter cibarius]TLT05354.1 hypothetical protein FE248_01275 [Aliarcobacter cibarius]
MKKAIRKISDYFSSNYEVLIATTIFFVILIAGHDFYRAIILMLEFIVVMEVVKMISDFIKRETLRLRFVIDIFIIFLIREVIILSANKNRDYVDIVFLLFVIFVFFLFRILAIKYSPGGDKKTIEPIKENDE